MVKTCKKCDTQLPIEQFYKHPEMADGYLNQCKACVKNRVGDHRDRNIESIRSYDRERGRRDDRKAKVRDYQRVRPEIHGLANRRWKENNPEKKRAHGIVQRAIRSGSLVRMPCFCGDTAEAHHPDYSKPLEVVWLCIKHHREIHRRYDSERDLAVVDFQAPTQRLD